MTDDGDQTFIPESYLDLYRDRHRRLTVSRAQLVERYDLSEDMATLLVEHGQAAQAGGSAPAEILAQCLRGLLAPPATFTPTEAGWIVQRLAELLGWAWPGTAPD